MSRLESQAACLPLGLSYTPLCAPPPQVPFQPPSCHRKGWLVGEGKHSALFSLSRARTRGKQSPASGSFRTMYLPASQEPPAFCSQGQKQAFQTWRISDRTQPSRSSRTALIRSLISEQQLTHFDGFTSWSLDDSVKWELLLSPFCRWGDWDSEWLSNLPKVSQQVNSKAKIHS